MPVNYDDLADVYSSGRSASLSVVNELITHSAITAQSRVLEVGCGTADHIAALTETTGCDGFGVEPSAGMRSHIPHFDQLRVIAGTAESLPLNAGLCDFLFTVNVVHHMTDPAAYFREARRVLKTGGRICTVTESADMIRRRSPLATYWPATVEPEIDRYPGVDDLMRQMCETGFADCEVREIGDTVSMTNAGAYQQKAFSALLLIAESDFTAGLRRLEADLLQGPVTGVSEYVCLWGTAGRGDC